jgi:hypothetical protein
MALKSLAISVLAILTCASCAPVRHEPAAQAEPGPRIVRHADLARTVVRLMGDEAKLPAAATALDYQNYLAGKGIAPLGGWRNTEPVTEGDLAVVTVRLFGLQDRIADPADEASYVALLKSRDVRAIIQ